MGKINPNKAGLVLGIIIGGWHLFWSILVLMGWAQAVIDFILWLHFIRPIYVVEPFSAGRAHFLVGLTAFVGYAAGWFFGILWNRMQRA